MSDLSEITVPTALAQLARETLCFEPSLAHRINRLDVPQKWEIRGGLTQAETSTLERRRAYLQCVLSPVDGKTIGTLIAPLAFSFSWQQTDVPEARAMAYRVALDEFPRWAIEKAVEDFLRGLVPGQSTKFAPTPAEMATRCREIVRPYRYHHYEVYRALGAEQIPDYSAEHKAKMADNALDIALNSIKGMPDAAE